MPRAAGLLTDIIAAGLRSWYAVEPAPVKRLCWPRCSVRCRRRERIVCVEDAAELAPRHPHLVKLVARGANVEGVGEVSLRQLVRQALRMRPDRIVVGEVRGAEVVDLLAALNTGHDGGAGTVHANSPGRGSGPDGGVGRTRQASIGPRCTANSPPRSKCCCTSRGTRTAAAG